MSFIYTDSKAKTELSISPQLFHLSLAFWYLIFRLTYKKDHQHLSAPEEPHMQKLQNYTLSTALPLKHIISFTRKHLRFPHSLIFFFCFLSIYYSIYLNQKVNLSYANAAIHFLDSQMRKWKLEKQNEISNNRRYIHNNQEVEKYKMKKNSMDGRSFQYRNTSIGHKVQL